LRSQQSIRVIAVRQPYAAFEVRPWRPPLNVYETDGGIMLVADLAGVDPAELHIHIHPGMVAVHGTRRLAAPEGLRRVHRMEIAAGPFELEVPLAATVDPEGAQARYADGLLEVWLPLAPRPADQVVVVRIERGGR
jgi:HSP20 family protein